MVRRKAAIGSFSNIIFHSSLVTVCAAGRWHGSGRRVFLSRFHVVSIGGEDGSHPGTARKKGVETRSGPPSRPNAAPSCRYRTRRMERVGQRAPLPHVLL